MIPGGYQEQEAIPEEGLLFDLILQWHYFRIYCNYYIERLHSTNYIYTRLLLHPAQTHRLVVCIVIIMSFGSGANERASNRNYWILSKEVYGRFVQKLVLKQFH